MSYNKNAVWGGKSNMNHQHQQQQSYGMNSGVFNQQSQVFQNMGLNQQNLMGLQQMANSQLNSLASNPIFQQQLGAVGYPRALNTNAFQSGNSNSGSGSKQSKVFTGRVTQIHDNFGFVDDEVFFPRNSCVEGSNPSVGDKVLVEASYNPNMPFKWNASRVQVLHGNQQSGGRDRSGKYNAVPPPGDGANGFGRRNEVSRDFGRDRSRSSLGERRNRSRDRDDDENDRKRRREERVREREKDDKERKSPVRRRSRSPRRRRPRVVPRYMVQIPKVVLDISEAELLEVKRRYPNLYIPSDFFNVNIRWVEAFPPDKPYSINKPCSFHIMNKELETVFENDAVLEPADADYSFSAKVMLLSMPNIEEVYQKCCNLTDDRDKRDRDSEEKDPIHPTRLINFLVGLRGKNETMAIGGPWSPSLDGENPESDPSVLIKTAIRTCKALTGVDLSNCTQWYRFVELYYRRSERMHKGKTVPARVETVVLYLPDVWSCLPTRLEWEGLQQSYRKHLEKILKAHGEEREEAEATDEKEEDTSTSEKLEPTPYSELDPKTMLVNDLRKELRARDLSTKGLKSQLVARLTKALKTEAEENGEEVKKDESANDSQMEVDQEEKDKKSEQPEEVKKLDEQQKRLLEKRYTLSDQPRLIVHPSKTAKSGKFDCTSMSLSLLLDYRPEDSKEHSFEVSLFAELFNEMLMRDFGFNIYKALYELPERPKESEEDKKKKDEKKTDKKDEDKKDKHDEDKKEKKDEEKTDKKEKAADGDDNKSEGGDSKKEKEEDDKKRESRKEERRSDDSDDDADGDERKDRKERDRKRKERPKLVTKDKSLLLSFIYFDQTQCGYIFDKDLEELMYTLGLNLARSQVRKLISKAIIRDSLHYRKLTDKPKEEEKEKMEVEEESEEKVEIDWHEVASGNKNLLPIFRSEVPAKKTKKPGPQSKKTCSSDDGLVVYKGGVVDIGKLLAQLDRSEKGRIEVEQHLVETKNENSKLNEKYNKSSSTIKHLNSEVKDYREKLRNTEDALGRANAHSKLFQTTLMDIRDKLEPILKTSSHKDKEDRRDRDRDSDRKKHDDGKSRWEKEKDSSRKEVDREREVKREADIKKEDAEKDFKDEFVIKDEVKEDDEEDENADEETMDTEEEKKEETSVNADSKKE